MTTKSRLVSRNIVSVGGRTSMRMEPEMWKGLEELCHREGFTASEFVTSIDNRRGTKNDPEGRTSAVRMAIFAYFKDAATPEGHALVGHGAYEPGGPAA